MLVGSIEAGGTKFVCAIGNDKLEIVDIISFPTTTPTETMGEVIEYFQQFDIKALSIASFGPIDINVNSSTYGFITTTPKQGWRNFDFLKTLKQKFNIPIFWTTDVNAAAYGEAIVDKSIDSLVYYTIGTGIGGGAIQKGEFIGGVSHTEMGHTFVKRHPKDLDFLGVCPFHGDCLEGLASGPTIEKRLGISAELLDDNHKIWDIISFYIAQAAMQATLILAPEKIVFGGGVVSRKGIIEKIRQNFKLLINDYVQIRDVDTYIVGSSYQENQAATIGNFSIALNNLKESNID